MIALSAFIIEGKCSNISLFMLSAKVCKDINVFYKIRGVSIFKFYNKAGIMILW